MSASLCCLSETNSRTVRAWLDRSKGWQKGKQLHPKPETVNVRYENNEKNPKWNQEVYKTFGRKNKLSPASMESMLWLHPLFKCRYKGVFASAWNARKDPWTKQQQKTQRKIKTNKQKKPPQNPNQQPNKKGGMKTQLCLAWGFPGCLVQAGASFTSNWLFANTM